MNYSIKFSRRVTPTEEPDVYDGNPEESTFYETEYLDLNPTLHLEDADTKYKIVRDALAYLPSDLEYQVLADIGCGSCVVLKQVLIYLIDHGNPKIRAIGVDVSRQILLRSEKHPSLVKLRADAANLPLENNSITLSICLDIVEHVKHPESILREIGRISRFVIFKIPLELSLYTVLRGNRRRLAKLENQFGHVHHFSRESIMRLTEVEFDILHESYAKIPGRMFLLDKFQDLIIRLKMLKVYSLIFGGFIILIAKSKHNI